MKMRRFNENQQYLTDPFDPEESVSYNVKSVFDSIEKNCKYIADKYNLDFKIETNDIEFRHYEIESRLMYTFSSRNKENSITSVCRFYICDDNPEITIECFDYKKDCLSSNDGFFTWSDVETYLKKYFKL